eukprot:6313353-Pyramimonas_sp.AAC.1
MEPSELAKSFFVSTLVGQAIDPSKPTCHAGAGKVYDYFAASSGLPKGAAEVRIIEEAGFFPHSPTCLEFHAGLAQMHYLAFRRPPPLPSE